MHKALPARLKLEITQWYLAFQEQILECHLYFVFLNLLFQGLFLFFCYAIYYVLKDYIEVRIIHK